MLETNKDLAHAEELSEKVVKNLIKEKLFVNECLIKGKADFFLTPLKRLILTQG